MTANPNPPSDNSKQVSLQQIAQQFMVGLQRHFDMLAYSLASRHSVREEDYVRYAKAPLIMPVTSRHQNFEQMQAYAGDLMLRQVIGDILNLSVTALNNAHYLLALVKVTHAKNEVSKDAQEIAQRSQKKFISAQLDHKFNLLEQDYGVLCEMEDSITSLAFCMHALVKQGGQVRSAQLDSNEELVVEYKAVRLSDGVDAVEAAKSKKSLNAKLSEQRKVFRQGDFIAFSDTELQLILVSVAAFADSLFQSVDSYAKNFKSPN